MKIKSINTFALIIILMIAVPEIVGHSLFDKPHQASSSVTAAITLADKISKDPKTNLNCNLVLEDDPSGSRITRASGIEGKYGDYSCT
jgi:hypothetical protein